MVVLTQVISALQYLKHHYKGNFLDIILNPRSLIITDVNTLSNLLFIGFGAYGTELFNSKKEFELIYKA